MTYRWLTEDEMVDLVNPAMQLHGWAELNTATARVLGAFDGGNLIEIFVLQLYPMLGPMVRLDNTQRDHGAVSRELANRMENFLHESAARGWMAIADSPVTQRLCERHGMKALQVPVYVANPMVLQ